MYTRRHGCIPFAHDLHAVPKMTATHDIEPFGAAAPLREHELIGRAAANLDTVRD